MTGKAGPEVLWGLDIAVRPVDVPLPVRKVDVRRDECPAWLQYLGDLCELLRLECPDILEYALGDDDVEPLVSDTDARFQDIGFH